MITREEATPRRLPAAARAAVAACILGMAAVALWAPYEILDGDFQRVDTARKGILSGTPPGRGVWRLHSLRLCIEEGLFLSVVIAVVVSSRVSVPGSRGPHGGDGGES